MAKLSRLASPPAAKAEEQGLAVETTSLSIVGIGASVGGLEAFEQFFRACPANSGMAFVLVPHLNPDFESRLAEILQRSTTMPVIFATDQIAVEADHIYIIPPNHAMAIVNGVLQLSVLEQQHERRKTINVFLRSLAKDQGEDAIGIILSGTLSDGTLGLEAIHDAGGICMVQVPSSTMWDGMPQSAITAGCATHILPVEKMPEMLMKLTRYLPSASAPTPPQAIPLAA